MTNTATEKTKRAFMTTAVTAATVAAGLFVALAVTPREAEATFAGNNGRIAFASNRTTGEGVNNPEGNFEIYKMRTDGTKPVNLTNDPAGDFTPDWQPLTKRY